MKRLAMTIVMVSILGTWAQADFDKGSQTIAVFGGLSGSSAHYSYQPGTDRPVTGAGGAIGGQYVYYAKGSPAIGIGLDLNSSMNGTRTDDDLLAGGYNTDQRLKSVIGLAIVKLAYPHGLFRPYVFGGMGVHSSSQLLTATPQPGVTWPNPPLGGQRVLVDEHKTSFALGGGVGFDLFLTETFFLGTELRGTLLTGLDTDDNAAIRYSGYTARNNYGISQGNILLRAGVKF